MSDGFDFGELRSLLNLPPSKEVWERLCKLLRSDAAQACPERWLHYADAQLDQRWPDELRVWPMGWWALKKVVLPATPLVRALEMYDFKYGAYPDLISALERAAPPLTTLRLGYTGAPSVAHCDALVSLTPALRDVKVGGDEAGRWLDAFGRCPTLPHISRLDLRARGDDLAALPALLDRMGALRELVLDARRVTPGAVAECGEWLAATQADRLEVLNLANTRLDEGAGEALASARWAALHTLDLSDTGLGDAALAAIIDAAPRLRTLCLREHVAVAPALRALTTTHATTLTTLDLSQRTLSAAEMELLRGATLPALETLLLQRCMIDVEMIDALSSIHAPALRTLEINLAWLSPGAFEALAAINWLPQLDRLWRHTEADPNPQLAALLKQGRP